MKPATGSRQTLMNRCRDVLAVLGNRDPERKPGWPLGLSAPTTDFSADAAIWTRWLWNRFARPRNCCILVGILLIAYALFGYSRGAILVFTGNDAGLQYAYDEQATWAAFGYASMAVGTFILAGLRESRRPSSSAGDFSHHAIFGIVFFLIGIVLACFRTPG